MAETNAIVQTNFPQVCPNGPEDVDNTPQGNAKPKKILARMYLQGANKLSKESKTPFLGKQS